MANENLNSLYIDGLYAETLAFLTIHKNRLSHFKFLHASGLGSLFVYFQALKLTNLLDFYIETVLEYKGISNVSNLKEKLQSLTFSKLGHEASFKTLFKSTGKKLTIYSYDIRTNRTIIFSYDTTPDEKCVDAVVNSCFHYNDTRTKFMISNNVSINMTFPIDDLNNCLIIYHQFIDNQEDYNGKELMTKLYSHNLYNELTKVKISMMKENSRNEFIPIVANMTVFYENKQSFKEKLRRYYFDNFRNPADF